MRIEDLPEKYQEQARKKLGKSLGKSDDKSKYNAVKTDVDGVTFDSRKEAERYKYLMMLQSAGVISDLRLQPRYLLQDSFIYDGKKIRKIEYIADFEYHQDGDIIVEDVKGYKTDVYKIKKKLFLKKYEGVVFREL